MSYRIADTPAKLLSSVFCESGDRVRTRYGIGTVTAKLFESCYPVRVKLDEDGREVGCFYSEVARLGIDERPSSPEKD